MKRASDEHARTAESLTISANKTVACVGGAWK